jgi:toxin-antitoxin system PIN domain toxin
MLSADTNLFLYAANPASSHQKRAALFFSECAGRGIEFATCEPVLVEIYMQLRNPSILRKPLNGPKAAEFCNRLRANPQWQHLDYHPEVSKELWLWAQATTSDFRRIIDARLALTLLHHGVTEFATANARDFQEFGFTKVWNPLVETK